MNSLCFPSGPKIRSGSISRVMLMHTQEVLWELGTSFQRLREKLKCLSLRPLCREEAALTLPDFYSIRLKIPASPLYCHITPADYHASGLCLRVCVCQCVRSGGIAS